MAEPGRTPSPDRAAWNKVHMATVRDGLWSPACTTEVGWVAPLADPDLAGQITCKVCHPLAMARNEALND